MERHALYRIIEIDRLLRENRYPNCATLRKHFIKHYRTTLSTRTIMRDIDEMKDSLGAPIEFNKEKNGYYYVTAEGKPPKLPPLHLTEGELVSVFLGEELLKKYRNTPFGGLIERAFKKIELLLPSTVSVDLNDISQSYSFDIKQTRELDRHSAGVFDILAKAIKNRDTVQINYYSIGRNAVQKRVIDPYHLRHTQGAWYLVGYCHLREDVRTFAVNQIKHIKLLPQKFEMQKGFSPEKFFADSWGFEEGGPLTKVVVKMDKAIARWFVDRKLHPSQKTKENKDGSLTLTFKVAGTEEIKRWILSLGRHARVVEPRELKEEIKEEAKTILKL